MTGTKLDRLLHRQTQDLAVVLAERDRYRRALEQIASLRWWWLDEPRKIAEQALKAER